MKKLRLKALSLGAREILSREQLRSITGGCHAATDCLPGQLCNYINQCENDPNGPSYPSGSGGGSDTYSNGCPAGQFPCSCTGFDGCVSSESACESACGV